MKFAAVMAALAISTVEAGESNDDKLHFFDFDNAKMIWRNDWEFYRNTRGDSNDCKLAESDNFLGAQQCKFSWECRGARTCERGGWCSGYDGCDGTPLPMQAAGLTPDH
uniref:Uncharacterized protein n=1 Tax=Strombidium rassoulzadegani TaxID=1082188 RepID=A0A7S3FTH7_9SPIT|mmetsp:Transcript_16751/g.28460  ORF Transcript_16751/g.28460 Transcript_16751/m.28460 type:complete len:109 (+) Transcript_16751:1-327(+)